MKTGIIFLLIFFVSNTYAQRFNAYVNAGMVASQVSGDALGGFDKAGVVAGVGVITPLSTKTSLGFEIGFLQKGSRKPSRLDQGDPVQYILRLNYIEIPVYIKYSLNRKISLFAGPSAGILLSSSEENENGELTYSLPFEKIDISVAGGAAYNLSNHWDVTFRAIQSLLPVREFGGQALPFFEGGQYNSGIGLLIAYYFMEKER